MKHRCTTMLAVACWSMSAVCAGAGSTHGDTYVSYSGTAMSARSDDFLYREKHVLHYRDGKIAGRVVLYTCRDGSAFARKTVSYVDALSPDFLLEDASNGMREGVRTEGGVRQVFFRNDRHATEKVGTVPAVDGLVADSGFDEFVRSNWQALVEGRALGMHFLVPSRLEEMSFKVAHVRSDHTDGIPVEVFRLKLSGILGWVAPSIDVYYSATDHTLIRYVGLSDLRDASSDNLLARIDFPPADRRNVDAAGMSSAGQVPLVPCR